MGTCEMCGKTEVSVTDVRVAGSIMTLCGNCSRHGESLKSEPTSKVFYRKKKEEEVVLDLRKDAISIIQRALAQKGWDSHHLARGVSIREGELNKYLSSKIKMDVKIASKIGKFLDVSLLEQAQNVNVSDYMTEDEEDDSSSSLGDILLKKLKESKK